VKVAVFFSRGMSLDGWRKAGILERELALYRALLPRLEHLAFLTYGGSDDVLLASQIPGIEVLPNRWRLPSNVYSVLAPMLHWRALRQVTVFKTNQINGAWCALLAARLFRKKLFVRCGFLWSDFVARLHPDSWRYAAAVRLERQVCKAADIVVVAAEADRQAIVARYQLDARLVHVSPNYVETSVFCPARGTAREPGRVIFVGRLEEQKNARALVEAVAQVEGSALTVIGDGPLRKELEGLARHLGADVTFLGRRPQAELPALLNQSSVFILPSHYEGNPKALLEAMACGLAVIGTRVPGIQEIVSHGETGILCGTSVDDIKSALTEVLSNSALRSRIGAAARDYTLATCTLESAVERELGFLESLDSEAPAGPT
jgi:glycosyltransferase involved in cell wall biosynthesis